MNDENLIPNSKRSPKEVRENGRKGGLASGRSRREKSNLRKAMQALLDGTYNNADGTTMTGTEAITNVIMRQALDPESKNWGKANDLILTLTNSGKSEEELDMMKAQAEMIRAKVDLMTSADTSAIDKLDEILKEMRDNAYSESKTE